jgi:ABC-2 type transport system ATP-binding protein
VTSPYIQLSSVRFTRSVIAADGKRSTRRVLNDVDLRISNGERVGLLGSNGAGKTTLLRIMGGIFEPDYGRSERFGSVGLFLDAGYGLDHRLTGRENCESRAVVAGMPREKHAAFVEWVESFSELGKEFDLPISTYSTGMTARLVFSICTYETPDILLIDEGIGTADAVFQQKAFGRLNELFRDVRILVLASHDQSLLKQLCTRGIVVRSGRVDFDGALSNALEYHLAATHRS